MKTNILATLVLALGTLSQPLSAASLQSYKGLWRNVDTNTSGVTKIQLYGPNAANLKMKVWGKCHPTDCEWGAEKAIPFGSSVSANLNSDAKAVMGLYDQGFSNKTLIIKSKGSNRLKVDVFTKFEDGSSRSDYVKSYVFKKIVRRPLPDLIVTKITKPQFVSSNNSSVFKVTVKNIGNATAKKSILRVIDHSTSQATGAPHNVTSWIKKLAPGKSQTVILSLPYWLYNPDASLEATADYKGMVPESKENNNVKKFFELG